ncbi:MAG TPA: hypothetical protein VHW67_10920 [Solirubrobacteraceae bacterium]|nr:hypothetical protein [Solirubrobacteraceae bacterium]
MPTASAETYGKLVVRHNALPAGALETQFSHVRPPRSFVLVVTEPTKEQLNFTWSLHCASSGRRESGGASGHASVAGGHWVKRIRADWIKHPASCSGSIVGIAPAGAVLVRVFTT